MKTLVILSLLSLFLISSVAAQTVGSGDLEGAVSDHIDLNIREGLICGNGICQEGEHLSCPQDCAPATVDLTCAFDGGDCEVGSLIAYSVLVLGAAAWYFNKRR